MAGVRADLNFRLDAMAATMTLIVSGIGLLTLVYAWQYFSADTPDLLEIGRLPFVTPYEKPTRHEALRYYRRVADSYGLQITFGEEVLAVVGHESPGTPAFPVAPPSRPGPSLTRADATPTARLASST